MATSSDIQHQNALLNTYRRNLSHLLRQVANLGTNQITTAQENSILDARDNIARIKNTLRKWNADPGDHPDDFESVPVSKPTQPVQVNIASNKVMLVIPVAEFAAMVQRNPELLNYIVYKS